jgi:hypothetical protein
MQYRAGSYIYSIYNPEIQLIYLLFSSFLFQFQTNRIDAVPLAAFVGRTVIENMAEVGAAIFANDFSAMHADTVIRAEFNVRGVRRFGKARPAGARIEFRVRRKKLRAARGALIDPLRMVVPIFSGECWLRAAFTHHVILLRRHFFLPFVVVLIH